MNLIQSKLADEFICLAGECPSTCCRDWNIIWHETEIEKLISLDDKILADKIPNAFCGEGKYRSICFNDEGVCPFVDESGLCEIHKKYGQDYISYVCREYPRISRVCNDTVLRSCRTSCYAVMDHICNNSDCMDIVTLDEVNTAAIISTENDGKRRLHIFNNVREKLWNKEKAFSIYNNVNANMKFAEIFGWDIITAKTDDEKQRAERNLSEYCCKEYENNLIKAVFLEWIINSFCPEESDENNLDCFCFCADTIKLAVTGAAYAAENREQFICTICDFISFLLSNTKKILVYLSYKQ